MFNYKIKKGFEASSSSAKLFSLCIHSYHGMEIQVNVIKNRLPKEHLKLLLQ